MKKTIIAYWVVVLLAFIACLYFAVYVTKAIADDSKDFSWASRSLEIIDSKTAENEMHRANKAEINKIIDENKKAIELEKCKIEKRDEKAVCEMGLLK